MVNGKARELSLFLFLCVLKFKLCESITYLKKWRLPTPEVSIQYSHSQRCSALNLHTKTPPPRNILFVFKNSGQMSLSPGSLP